MSDMFTYDSFEPGKAMGSVQTVLGDAFCDLWRRIYPADELSGDLLPIAASTVILMKAWRTIVDPRPPGNVHASQKVHFTAAPRLGETVNTEVRCIAKELRKDRKFVTLLTQSTGDGGRALFTGETLLIWAI
jgi:hypothetical protein